MDYSFQQYVESRDKGKKKKKRGLKMTLDIEGEPVIVGGLKKETRMISRHDRRGSCPNISGSLSKN